jgi:hypothetical protein
MNLQVPISLIKNRIYGTFYHKVYPFDLWIQTGPTVLLPIALSFKILGISIPSAGIVFELYFMLCIILLAMLSAKAEGNVCGIIGLVSLIFTPYLLRMALGGYGEFPTLFFLLLSILLLEKWVTSRFRNSFLFFSGIVSGLAFLTKVIALLHITGLLFTIIAVSIVQRRIRNSIIFLIGFFIPMLLWEIYKFCALYKFYGTSEAYIEWWKIIKGGIIRKGIGTAGKGLFIKRFSQNLTELSKILKVSKHILILSIFFSFGYYLIELINIFKRDFLKEKFVLKFSFFAITFLHLTWWLFFSPDPWFRRAIIGIVMWKMVVASSAILFFGKILLRKKLISFVEVVKKCISVIFLIICIKGVLTPDIKLITWSFHPSPKLVAQKKMAKIIQTLPKESEILTYSWWQCPDISFLSGRTFKDITNPDVQQETEKRLSYVLLGEEQKFLDPKSYWWVKDSIIGKKVAEEGNYELYEFTNGNYHPSQSEFILKNAPFERWASEIDFVKKNYHETQLGIGFGWPRQNGILIGQLAIVWLKYNGEKKLFIKGYVPPDLQFKEPLTTTIFVNETPLKPIYLENNGIFFAFLDIPRRFSPPIIRIAIKVSKFSIHNRFKYYRDYPIISSIILEKISLLEEEKILKYESFIDITSDSQLFGEWYRVEGKEGAYYRWTGKKFGFYLDNSRGYNNLLIKGYSVVDKVVDGFIEMNLYINDKFVFRHRFEKNGEFLLSITLSPEIKKEKILKVDVELDKTFRAPPDIRDLGLLITHIELKR